MVNFRFYPPGCPLSDVQLDRFKLSKFFDGKAANFTALPAFFKSAEWKFRIALQKCVYPNGARANAPASRQGRVEVPRPYTGRQAVICVVGDFDCFLSRVEGEDRKHRSENFFPCDGHFGRDAVKYSRFNKLAIQDGK